MTTWRVYIYTWSDDEEMQLETIEIEAEQWEQAASAARHRASEAGLESSLMQVLHHTQVTGTPTRNKSLYRSSKG